jgi:hypothetical protein
MGIRRLARFGPESTTKSRGASQVRDALAREVVCAHGPPAIPSGLDGLISVLHAHDGSHGDLVRAEFASYGDLLIGGFASIQTF